MSVATSLPHPLKCDRCDEDATSPDHWRLVTGRWKCGPTLRAYERQQWATRGKHYYKENARQYRWRNYRGIDNRKYGGGTIPWEDADTLMGSPCTYCGLDVSEGLDRRDSSSGHTKENVVPCCAVCNEILVDLPQAVKDLLAPGLQQARAAGLLDTWRPPASRNRKGL